MTSEVVLMNKAAVAMAADSAVTISHGRKGFKTYHTVNKVFELKRGSGVGVMIYNNAEFNGVPWETVIKRFRQQHPGRHPKVTDYVDEFLAYLATDDSAPPEHDSAVIIDAINQHTLGVFAFLERRASDWISGTGTVKKAPLERVFSEHLDLFEARLKKSEKPKWSTELKAQLTSGPYRQVVTDFVAEMFVNFPLKASSLKRLEELLCLALIKCVYEPSESGLVIAGFGEKESFPVMVSCRIRGRINGIVRSVHPQTVAISLDTPSHIQTFAQDEQARGFLTGITNQVRSQVLTYWREWSKDLERKTVQAMKTDVPAIKSAATRDKVAKTVAELARQGMKDFGAKMAHHESEFVFGPMLKSVAVLPKDEVGTLASSLVNVTSLRQKMSISDLETVGGPVDCALISPGDGFVWLNRKHYFDPNLNPSWHLKQDYAGETASTGRKQQ